MWLISEMQKRMNILTFISGKIFAKFYAVLLIKRVMLQCRPFWWHFFWHFGTLLHLVALGCTWLHLGSIGIHLDAFGSVVIHLNHLDPLGSIWISLDPFEPKWIHLDLFGSIGIYYYVISTSLYWLIILAGAVWHPSAALQWKCHTEIGI